MIGRFDSDDDEDKKPKPPKRFVNAKDVNSLKINPGDSNITKSLKVIGSGSYVTGATSDTLRDLGIVVNSIEGIFRFYDNMRARYKLNEEERNSTKRIADLGKFVKTFDKSPLKVVESDGYRSRQVMMDMFNQGFPIQEYPEYFDVDKLKVLSHIVAIMIQNNLPLKTYVPHKLNLDQLNRMNLVLIGKYGYPTE